TAGWFLDPEAVQADAVDLLAARESRLVVSDQTKAEREDAIVGRVISRELGPEARRRWARRLAEMALVFDATERADTGGLARAAAGNGVVLGGGSRFGEEAIYGVMRWLEERGVGFAAGPAVVPHVPGAFLFDLGVGDRRARPTREMGYDAAARAVASPVAEGSVGAGAGASVGKIHGIARAMRGGIGGASVRLGEVVVRALVAVNAVGDVRDPDTGALVAGTR